MGNPPLIQYRDLKTFPHHDGSELYVQPQIPIIGGKITLRVRVPRDYTFEKAFVRFYEDGEPRTAELILDARGKEEDWWKVELDFCNKELRYRFVFLSRNRYEWLNGRGLNDHDVHSNNDFVVFSGTRAPEWTRKSVFYQIFPDRFAKSSTTRTLPAWAIPKKWSDSPAQVKNQISTEFFGGDIDGVVEKLDYIEDLGINGIYFTPFFPARSNHRYDASSFDEVDPLLGGDKAFAHLISSSRKRDIKILGDLTSNHCGAGHPWLAKALANKDSVEHSFFYWDSRVPHGYVGWWGVASLPKLNFNSFKLRELMYASKDSIVRRWISSEKGLSGWRIDVGNMTGRQGSDDLHAEVMHGIRKAIDQAGQDFWLIAENGDFDAADLDGTGWHGAMNYQGFMRPVWNWLHRNNEIGGGFQGLPFSMPSFTGVQLVASMKEFSSSVPWTSFVSSMLLLDSHDTARFRTVVMGDRAAHLSGMALLMTYPGVPSIFAGDELGLEGTNGEDARRTIDWEGSSQWDYEFLADIKKLISLRRTRDALIQGGLRWVEVADDYLLFLRESKDESLLIFISRVGINLEVDIAPLGYKILETLSGVQAEGQKLIINSSVATHAIWKITA